MLTETCKCGAPFLPCFPTRDGQVRSHSSSQFQSSTVFNSCGRLRNEKFTFRNEKGYATFLVPRKNPMCCWWSLSWSTLYVRYSQGCCPLSKWGLLKHQHCLAANIPRNPDTLPALHCQACVFPCYTSVLLCVPQSLHSVCKVPFSPTFLPLPS